MNQIGQATRKRQSLFYVTSITYILVYIFSVSITGVQEIGLKIVLPKEFAPTLIFFAAIFLGIRYFLDIWGEINFFKWLEIETKEVRDLTNGIEQYERLSVYTDIELSSYSRSLITDQRPLCLPADLANFCSLLASKIRDDDNDEARKFLEENRSWLRECCRRAVRTLKWKRIVALLGIANIISIITFDILIPLILFLLIIYIRIYQPHWMLYKAL